MTSFKITERLFNVTVRLITDFQTDSQYRNILYLNAKYFKLAIKICRNQPFLCTMLSEETFYLLDQYQFIY